MKIYRQLPVPVGGARKAVIPAVLLLAVFLLFPAMSALAAGQSTAFLPLKINASKNVAEVAAEADKYLSESLASHAITPLARSQAEALADYMGSWPPPPAVLQKIAAGEGRDNVAAGSLTLIGNQISIDLKVFDALTPNAPKYFFSKGDYPAGLQSAINNVVLDVLAYTEREMRIDTISPEGNRRIDSGAILRKISSRAGGAYNPATLREDLKAIYAMGYFNDVQINVTDGANGKKVVFKVVEKPTIAAVTFSGIDELEEKDVKSAANIREHFILNPAAVTTGAEAIKELYKSKGFYNTQVTSEITYPSDQGAVIAYTIVEGKKIYIKEISFEGNTAFDDDELEDEIETSEKGFFSWITASGLLEMDKIKQDVGKIVAFYNNHGYLETRIGEPVIRQEGKWLYLTFNIDEGPRYKVGTIDVSGDLITDKQNLIDLLSIRKEEYMNRGALREDALAVTDFYAEQGYAFAEAKPEFKKSVSGNRIDVNFQIKKGDLVYINRIIIKGNTRTRDNVIRREILVAEGGIFNSKALRDSSKALQRLQYFDEVNITPEPTIEPARMNIIIDVKERSTGTFSIGVGYSSVDDIILTGSISENNFLGRGDQLEFSANIGGSSSRYNLGYTNPHLYDSPLSWGADLFNTEREYDDYTKESLGGALRLGYPLYEKWKIFGNYTYTDTDLSDIDDDASFIIKESTKVPISSSVEVSLVRDTRDKTFAATEGAKHQVSTQYAGGPFAGDAQFTKVEASTSWYFPLFWKTVFHAKGAAGQVFENETDKLPVYDRFYLGGINTVRGFEFGKISPVEDGDRIGGDKMWYTNLEFIFPIIEEHGIQGLTFFDAGQVYNDGVDWTLEDFEKAAGLGIRWLSPMGPISVVWGVNLAPEDDEDQSVFDFSLGGTF